MIMMTSFSMGTKNLFPHYFFLIMQANSFRKTRVIYLLLMQFLHCAFQIYFYKIPRKLQIYSSRNVLFFYCSFSSIFMCAINRTVSMFLARPVTTVYCKTRPILLPKAITSRFSNIWCNFLYIRSKTVYISVHSWHTSRITLHIDDSCWLLTCSTAA
jgi:hypothetical protein